MPLACESLQQNHAPHTGPVSLSTNNGVTPPLYKNIQVHAPISLLNSKHSGLKSCRLSFHLNLIGFLPPERFSSSPITRLGKTSISDSVTKPLSATSNAVSTCTPQIWGKKVLKMDRNLLSHFSSHSNPVRLKSSDASLFRYSCRR